MNAAEGLASIDLGLGDRFGAQLAFGLGSPLRAAKTPGSVEASRTSYALAARVTWFPLSRARSRLSLSGGPFLERLSAQSAGYSQVGEQVAYGPGLGLSLVWEQPLAAAMSVWGGPTARYALRKELFDVQNVGTVLETPRLWVGAEAGLAWRFF